jgi:hypothetical protein
LRDDLPLKEFSVASLFHYGLVAGLTSVIIALLAVVIGRARPKALEIDRGTIVPEKLTAAITVVFGAAMLVVGVLVVLAGQWLGGGLATLSGAAIGGFMLPSLSSLHRVSWSPEAIEGPSRLFGLTLGTARTSIAWTDIRATGKTMTSYWFVEAADGRRVYWSYLYKGYRSLVSCLIQRRPDLELPEDMAA